VCQQSAEDRNCDESSLREKLSFCHAAATFNNCSPSKERLAAAKVKPLCGIHLSCNVACNYYYDETLLRHALEHAYIPVQNKTLSVWCCLLETGSARRFNLIFYWRDTSVKF
jgi:hypothetical protein